MSKTGYCSLCRHPKVKALNNAIIAGKGYTVASREMEQLGMKFAKATFLTHKAHLKSPLMTDAEVAHKEVPVSNRAVLEAIRDIGMKKALDDPDAVNVNHALRAAKILQDAEGKQETILVLLAKAVQGPPPEIIDGEYVEQLETSEVS